MKLNDDASINELVAASQGGNTEAFCNLSERFAPLIASLKHKFQDAWTHDGDDIAQDARLALYKAVMSYDTSRQDVSFGLYAKICMTNALISKTRSSKKQNDICSLDEMTDNHKFDFLLDYTGENDPSESLIRKEKVEQLLKDAYANLSEYEIAVFNLYIDGRKPSNIARLLGKSEKSVNNAIHRFKDKLRQLN